MPDNQLDIKSILARVKRNLGILLSGTIISLLIGFCTATINARTIGASGVGVIALFQSSAMLIVGLLSIGSQQPVIRLGRQAISEGRPSDLGLIAGLAISADLLAATIAGLLSVALIVFFGSYLGLPKDYAAAALIYTAVIFTSGTNACNGIYRLLGKFHYISTLQVLTAAGTLLLTVALWKLNATVDWYVTSYGLLLSCASVSHLLVATALLRDFGSPVRFDRGVFLRRDIYPEFISYAWTTSGTSLINSVKNNLDVLALGFFAGPAVTGTYTVAKQLAGVFSKASGSVYSVTFPEISALAAKNDFFAAKQLKARLIRTSSVFSSVAVIGSLLFGESLLRICFGPEFSAISSTLTLLIIAAGLQFAGAFLSMFVQVFVSPTALLLIYAYAMAIFLPLMVLTTYTVGAVGAAVGQATFALALLVGCTILLRQVLNNQK